MEIEPPIGKEFEPEQLDRDGCCNREAGESGDDDVTASERGHFPAEERTGLDARGFTPVLFLN